METLKKIRKDVEELTEKGYLQAARLLLNDVSSEITISTSSLPLASYPDALKQAVKLTKEKRHLDAALVLTNALNTIVVEVRSVPLPLVRAERMLASVDTLLAANDVKTDDINTLLDNADYQIRFAEALGYGKKDKEFEELYSAIKELKAEVKKKGANAKKMNSDLRNKLKLFKTRISPREKKAQG
jgi:molybdenum cofactor biosynthesis enzyme MoaA